MPLRLSIIIFSLLTTLQVAAQNPQLAWHNYTTDDGLAANEVHYCLETPDGYMWFATDNGLSRFDGYEFKNYGSREGLGNPVVFYLQLDPQGRLWMASISGELFYMEQDRIYPFEHNDKILALKDSVGYDVIEDFYIDGSNNKFLSLRGAGILEFRADGDDLFLQPENNYSKIIALKIGQRWMTSSRRPNITIDSFVQKKYFDRNLNPPIFMIADSIFELGGVEKSQTSGSYFVKRFNSGRMIIFGQKHLYEIDNNKIIWSKEVSYDINIKALYEIDDNHIYVGLQHGFGLRRYKSLDAWKNEEYEQYLEGKFISHIIKDSENNFWVTTIEHGIFFCPNLEWVVYDNSTGLSNDNISSIALKNKNEVFVGLRNGRVYKLKTDVDFLSPLPLLGARVIYDLIYHLPSNELWVAKQGEDEGHRYWKNGKWDKVSKINSAGGKSTVIGKNLTLRKGGRRIWGGNTYRFGAIDILDKKIVFDSEGEGMFERTMAVWESEDSTIWVGNGRGLFILKGGSLISPSPFHSSFETRVDDLTEMSDGTLVVATKGEGVLLVKGSQLHQINSSDGLTSDIADNVYVDAKDNIWAGTPVGLNKINKNGSVIKQITIQHGLPSNEINQVEVWEEDVWVATTKGLVHFKDNLKVDSFSRTPIFPHIFVNDVEFEAFGKKSLSHKQNNIVIDYLTINFQQHGRIPYRHRLLPIQDKWVKTQQRSVNFSALQPGNYSFEVQSQNQDGIWSESAIVEFEILPPWWFTWWAISLGILMVIGIGIGIYKYRTGHLKKEIELQKRLAEVERQALRSQMNPHFIFNSLNAIQG